MFKQVMVIALGVLMIGLAGCKLQTPEIRGVVLDAETKEPVKGAWVTSDIEIKTKTVGGDVTSILSVDPPHARTGKDGKFVIPSRSFKTPLPPMGFGTEVLSFGVHANTADWKGRGMDLKEKLGKRKVEVTLEIESYEKYYEAKYKKDGIPDKRIQELIELELFSDLQALFNYCLIGRFSVEVPPVEGGCDEWELNFAITKHERYLERYKEIKTSDHKGHYSGTLKNLGYLYKKKRDYEKALETFKRAKEFDERHYQPPIFWLKEYENQINELQQLLQQKQK